jgi:hypothetical protein
VTPVSSLAQSTAQSARAPKDLTPVKDQFTVSAFYWKPDGQPGFRAGAFVADPTTRFLDLTKKPNRASGFNLTFPTGSFNRLEVGAWRLSDGGVVFAPDRLNLFGANIKSGERLDTIYRITNLHVAWNYLTFPAPPFDAKLRVKTFWEFQYNSISPVVGFPDVKNSPEPIRPSQSVMYPGAGLGLEFIPSRHFRVEARGSGMAFPGRSGYYDVEASMVGRIKMVELFAGAKLYHLHSSPKKNDAYIQGTFFGPMVGLRWVIF